MQTTATKDNPTAHGRSPSSQPFFSKREEGGLFTQTQDSEQPFFAPTILRHAETGSGNDLRRTPFFQPHSQPVVQAKLTINEPGDQYEQEADTMADQVMKMSAEPPADEGSAFPPDGEDGRGAAKPLNINAIQHKCSTRGQEETVQRHEMEEEEPLQAKPLMRKAADGGYTASPQLASQLDSSKGGGDPLPGRTLASMNQAFGEDFSNVRVHTGSQAAEMSQGIQAKAFTHGSDVYFNHGQYSPESSEGKRLLGHELTHVVQQTDHSFQTQPTVLQRSEFGNAVRFDSLPVCPPRARVLGSFPDDLISRELYGDSNFHIDHVAGDEYVIEIDYDRLLPRWAPYFDESLAGGECHPILIFDLNRPPMPGDDIRTTFEVRSDSGMTLFWTLRMAWNHLERYRPLAQQELDEMHALAERLQGFLDCPDAPTSIRRDIEVVAELVHEIEMLRGMLDIEGDEEVEREIGRSFEVVANLIRNLEPTFQNIDTGHITGCLSSRVGPFVDGLLDGLRSLRNDEFQTLLRRYTESSVFNALFPPVFTTGAVVGIGEDAFEVLEGALRTVISPLEAARNAIESAEAFSDLVHELTSLEGGELARHLGRNAGLALAGELRALIATDTVVEFSFELGRLIGPAVVYTVLSFLGFEAAVAGRLFLWSSTALRRLRNLRAFERLRRLLPDVRGRRPGIDAPSAPQASPREVPAAPTGTVSAGREVAYRPDLLLSRLRAIEQRADSLSSHPNADQLADAIRETERRIQDPAQRQDAMRAIEEIERRIDVMEHGPGRELVLEQGGTLSTRVEWTPPPGTPPRPLASAPPDVRRAWLRQRLQLHVDEARRRFEVEGLTPGQAARVGDIPAPVEPRPEFYRTFRGSRIDQFAKDSIIQDPDLAEVITAPDFVSEPDFLDSILPDWFDATTRGQWLAHLRRYQVRYGTQAHRIHAD